MDPIIHLSAALKCEPEKAYELFTQSEHLQNWLTVRADVVMQQGGKYELFWEPEDPENNSTLGCKVLAFEKPHFINFEWKGPKQFKHFMNSVQPLSNVSVCFFPFEHGCQVQLIHTGWRNSDEWEEARQYFIRAWDAAFQQLQNYAASFSS